MIEYLVKGLVARYQALTAFFASSYHWLWDTLEILVVAMLCYGLSLLVRGTRAMPVLMGIVALIAFRLFADFVQFLTLRWILDTFFVWFPIILVILFADDLRRLLGQLGRRFISGLTPQEKFQLFDEIVPACKALSEQGRGALIVIEHKTRLDDHLDTPGKELDALLTSELLLSIFMHGSPLHDGAVLVQNGRLSQAGVILPLTTRIDLPRSAGTRHRAAVGISEQSDAAVVVVSEESGRVSLATEGELHLDIDPERLADRLREYLAGGVENLERAGDAGAPAPAKSAPAPGTA